jgi:hypothetical protein
MKKNLWGLLVDECSGSVINVRNMWEVSMDGSHKSIQLGLLMISNSCVTQLPVVEIDIEQDNQFLVL